jgi:hypothetical protein
MDELTLLYLAAILYIPSTHLKVGFSTPNKGYKRPLSTVVFLHLSKSNAALIRALSIMVDCIGRPLKRSAGSFAGVENPIQSAAQCFSILCVGYLLLQRNRHVTR